MSLAPLEVEKGKTQIPNPWTKNPQTYLTISDPSSDLQHKYYFSTLLSLLLNELEIKNGYFDGFESFGYASQESWMIAGTIKENILMGRKFNKVRVQNRFLIGSDMPNSDWLKLLNHLKKKYDKVVEAASLIPDFKLLE